MNKPTEIFLTGLFVLVLILVFYGVGPAIETKFFPVYSKFKLVKVESTPTGVLATFQYTKWRNCDPQGYGWYNGDVGTGYKQLNTERIVPQPVVPRPLGTNLSSPIRIEGITVEDLTYQVFAELYSRCHPFWLTRTVVYP